MKMRYVMGRIYRLLGRCYYCGHTEADHLNDKIRECKRYKCDCFGWDEGPYALQD